MLRVSGTFVVQSCILEKRYYAQDLNKMMNLGNYMMAAVRTLPAKGRRNTLKVLTLGIGLAVGLVLTSKVCFEQTYDDFFSGAQRIFYVSETAMLNEEYKVYNQTSGGIAPRMKEYFPQVEEATRFTWFEVDANLIMHGTKAKIDAGGTGLADSSFFRVLDRKCLAGDITEALGVEGNAAVSFSVAKKIASSMQDGSGKRTDRKTVAEQVIGERFSVAGWGNGYELTISGVFEDYPLNSSLRPQVIVSLPTIGSFLYDGSDGVVGNDRYSSFLKLREASDAEVLNGNFQGFVNTYLPVEELTAAGYDMSFIVKPLTGFHNEDENRRNMTLLLAFVAFALLLTSVLNYLLTVLSTTVIRSREMALRKCLGSGRREMLGMMFAESLVHTLFACSVAAVLIFAFRSTVEELLGTDVESLFSGRQMVPAVLVVAALIIINTVFPAHFFNRIPVAAAFRNYSEGRRRWKLGLLAAEFAAVAFLAVVLCVISLQYDKMSNADLGFDYENVAMISLPEATHVQKNTLMAEIRALSDVDDAAFAYQNPFDGYSGDNVSIPGESRQLFNVRDAYYVDSHWLNVFSIRILEGDNFDEALSPDREVLVDERFVDMMKTTAGWDGVLGRDVDITAHEGPTRICGVFRTINQGSFRMEDRFYANRPMAVFYCDPQQYSNFFKFIFVKYHRISPEALEHTQAVVNEILPGQASRITPCSAVALGNLVDTRNTRNAVFIGGVVSLIIALLGLVGYTVDEVRRRGKEIAVRRVNGAQFSQIRAMFIRDVMWIAGPSAAFGCVLAGIIAARWEQQFSIQAGLPWWIFAVTFTGVLGVVAVVSDVYVQMVANRNPAESIKTE